MRPPRPAHVEYVVRCSWEVNVTSDAVATLLALRESSIIATFERDAGGVPTWRGNFRSETVAGGKVIGMRTMTFEAGSIEEAWTIWRLGTLNHPMLDWDLRRVANEGFLGVSVPDVFPG